jgi:hypothetical protein
MKMLTNTEYLDELHSEYIRLKQYAQLEMTCGNKLEAIAYSILAKKYKDKYDIKLNSFYLTNIKN